MARGGVSTKRFESKKKNGISLRDDEFLDEHLKPIKIGDKNTCLQLSDNEFRVDGDFFLRGKLRSNKIESEVSYLDFIANYFRFFPNDVDDGKEFVFSTTSSGQSLMHSQNTFSIISTGDLTLDSTTDIVLDADGGDVFLKDNLTQFMKLNVDGVFLKDNAAVHLNDTDADKVYGDGDDIYISKDDTDIWAFKDAETLTEVPLKIKESADAVADSAGYGQIWVDTATPNELAFTDDAGTDIIGIGKYHYETKYIGYYATATGIYLPMTGYVFESTTTSGKNEFLSFLAPYNGTIQKLAFRSEIAQDGNINMRVFESSDATEIPGSNIFRQDTAVDIADDVYQELSMTSPSVGSDYSPLTKGRIYNIFINTPSASNDTNVTIVFKWDITS